MSSFILALTALGGFQRVGAGQLIDRQGDRGLAVERAGLVVALGAELDRGHVRRRTSRPSASFLRIDVARTASASVSRPKRRDRVLKHLAVRHRRLADLPGRDLDVLLRDRGDHVAGGQAARTPSSAGSSQTRML